ncbi:MAG TPA: hypothetical protein VFV67_23225 [Actinophytocola sp.]|uniref:hypothetical protein n=1 Tax=Actinophytocola sp. TaxID=1872138 RepID=UPI002DB5D0F3|nr:hypothetical protein [Actinophytocola sp.]HEU5473569.1 hypothetical protein [Actinophytocola sp.]
MNEDTERRRAPSAAGRRRMPRRLAPAIGLFVLAPVCAEYLAGYDDSVGRVWALLGGLLILGPLYGGPALIIREVVRRTGRGWPSMLLLAVAFGLVQAGLVDQSLFDPAYRDIDSWAGTRNPTAIPALGISVHTAIVFVAGHVVWSLGAPIAMVESLVPQRATTPWLGRTGLAVTGVLYVLAALLIFADHQNTQQFLATLAQLISTTVLVAALIVVAFLLGRQPRPAIDRAAPRPWRVGALAVIAFGVFDLAGTDWLGVAVQVTALTALVVLVGRGSRRTGWGPDQRLALAAAPLLTRSWIAFLVPPLGDSPLHLKLAHNAFFAVGIVLLVTLGLHALHRNAGNSSGSP